VAEGLTMEAEKKRTLMLVGVVVALGALIAYMFAVGAGDGTDESETLATIGDAEITDADFEAYLEHKHLRLRDQEQADRVLEDLVDREALARAIESSGELDARELEAELAELRREMLISRYFDQYLRTAATDEAIRNYYESHAADYEDRKVHVGHILVRMNRRMTEEQRQAALTKAREAFSKLQAGEDFAQVVAQYSEDRVTVNRDGDLGWVREGTISPRFSEVAFSLEEGAVSEPFETPFGYHIIKVLEPAQTVRRPLEAVEGRIRADLRQQAKEAEVQRLRDSVERSVREGGYSVEENGSSSMRVAEPADSPDSPQEEG